LDIRRAESDRPIRYPVRRIIVIPGEEVARTTEGHGKRGTENLEAITNRVLQNLSWKIVQVHQDRDSPALYSDYRRQTHILTLPRGARVEDMPLVDLLHELGHAALAETIDPIFSAIRISQANELDHLVTAVVLPALNSVNDWFVEAWLMSLLPEAEARDVLSTSRTVRIFSRLSPDAETFFTQTLLIAKARKYLEMPIPVVPKYYAPVIDAFLRTDPVKPSVDAAEGLANAILHPFLEEKLLLDRENHEWRVVVPHPGERRRGDIYPLKPAPMSELVDLPSGLITPEQARLRE
jgi:hypothetical protein